MKMSLGFSRICLALLLLSIISFMSDAELEQFCVADEQTPDDVMQAAMTWACQNGADCSKIQIDQPCYIPNTLKDHASFAFNSYFQKFKNQGGSCYFRGAAMITDLDPSNGACRYDYIP